MAIVPRWFRRRDPDAELDEEFATHVSLEIERQIDRGLTREEAQAAADRKFGNRLRYREEVRELASIAWLENVLFDIRGAAGALARRKVATTAAVLALALGMGGPTAIVMMLANVSTLVYPLVKNPDRLVIIWETPPNEPGRLRPAVDGTWRVLRDHPEFFAAVSAAGSPVPLSLTLDELPEQVTVQTLAASLLPLIGVAPYEGRGFVASDEAPGADPVALVSYAFWQVRLGGSPTVVGTTLRLDGRRITIIGIMPRGFWISNRGVDLWVPMPQTAAPGSGYAVIARLEPGDDRDSLRARLAGLTPQIAAATSDREAGWGLGVVGMGPRSILDSELPPGVIMLIVATGLTLLVACVNVAMVMVARGAARQKETAIRSALGAARGRLIRQFLAESTLVAVAAGGLALFVAYAAMRLIAARVSADLPVALNVHMDWRVVFAILGISALVGIVSGLAPALADSRINLVGALKETGFFTAAPGRARLRRALIVVEVALTVMLVACVSLLVRGVFELEGTNPGFDPENLLRVRLEGVQHIGRLPSREPDFRDTIDRLAAVRGVQHLAAVTAIPPGMGEAKRILIAQDAAKRTEASERAYVNAVSRDYFRTLGLAVLDGEPFSSDGESAPEVAVVSRAFSARVWPGQRAVGQSLRLSDESRPRQVVAVVSDQLLEGGRRAPSPMVFVPFKQAKQDELKLRSLTLLVRTEPGATDVAGNLRRAVAEADPLQPLNIASVQDILFVGAKEVRVGALLATPLMLLALLLTVSGIYGLIAQGVAHRTHELAVRVTLGAGRRDLLGLVAREGVVLAGVGAVCGIAAAWVVDQSLSAFLFGVPGDEPIALAGSGLLMILITLAASMAPYRRARRIDPGRTLRYE